MISAFELVESTPDQVYDLLDVLGQARDFKSQFDTAWQQEFTEAEVAELIANGGFYAALVNNVVAACVLVLKADERIWGQSGLDDTSLYVHRLATGSNFRGQGLGGEIINRVGEMALSSGRAKLRLDCPSDNQGLVDYYLHHGFELVGQIEIIGNRNPSTTFSAAKMEKTLS